MLVATAAAEVPEAVPREFPGGLQEHLAAPCQLHRSGIAAGREPRRADGLVFRSRKRIPVTRRILPRPRARRVVRPASRWTISCGRSF